MGKTLAYCGVAALALSATGAFAQTAGTNTAADTPASSATAQASDKTVEPVPIADADTTGAVTTGDIVVTAQRSSQLLSRTPIAVTALGQTALEEKGIRDVTDLSTQAPNLQVTRTAGDSQANFTIRGITTSNLTDLGNPAVAFHVDGVYLGRPLGVSQLLYDVERVEILRGPQGTLYGRGATAGSLNVITARPDHNGVHGRADLSYGNYSSVAARALVNLPVTDTLALRFSGAFNRNDGFQGTQGRFGRIDKAKEFAARAGLLWQPVDPLSVYLTYDHYQNKGLPSYAAIVAVRGAAAPSADVRNRPVTGRGSIKFVQDNLRARVDLKLNDQFSLAYFGGYSRGDRDTLSFPDASLGDSSNSTIGTTYKSQSHEADLNFGTGGAPLHGLIGGFYYRDRADKSRFLLNLPAAGISYVLLSDYAQQSSKAAFGQVTYDAAEGLHLTGGLRYTKDKLNAVGFFTYICPFGANFSTVPTGCFITIDNSREGSFSATTYRAAADYQISPTLFSYGSISTGYKPGGFGDAGTPRFDPEHVTNYEIGLKSQLLGRTLSLNLALFYMDYSDLQVSQAREVSPGQLALVTLNAAKAKNRGAELEYSWKLSSSDRLSGYLAVLKSTYGRYIAAPDQFTGGTASIDVSGNHLIKSPGFSQQIRYEHDIDFSNGARLTPSASFFYQAKMYLREYNTSADLQKSYTRTDLQLTYKARNDAWFAEAFVYNLENNDVRTSLTTAAGLLSATYAAPRTYGGRIGFKF